MGIWTHSLKFNIGTGGIHQLPQTTEYGIHSLLQEVVWDVGHNVPNPVMAVMSIDETANMENGLVTPENVFKGFWPIEYLMPTYLPTTLYIYTCRRILCG